MEDAMSLAGGKSMDVTSLLGNAAGTPLIFMLFTIEIGRNSWSVNINAILLRPLFSLTSQIIAGEGLTAETGDNSLLWYKWYA